MVLDGLDDIDWGALSHAYGSAEDVPALLRALLSADAQTRDDARSELYGNIWHQGTVYAATVHAVPFLFRMAMAQQTPDRVELVAYIGALAEGIDRRAAAYQDVYAAVLRRLDDIRVLLADGEPLVRAGASYILGSLQTIADEAGGWLRAAIDCERDELVRCAMLLSLSRLGDRCDDGARWLALRFSAAVSEPERMAAAIALAHTARETTPQDAIEMLALACTDVDGNSERWPGIPWDLVRERLPGGALVAVGPAALPVVSLLVDRMLTASAVDASFILDDAFSIVRAAGEAGGQTDGYRDAIVEAMVRNSMIWKNPGVFGWVLMREGLPSDRDALRAWLRARPT